jgi:RimJ/RimL family protein N-acetyltransferase
VRETIFQTPRVRVRNWAEADFEAYFSLYGDPKVTRHFSWHLDDMEKARDYFPQWISRNERRGPDYGCWAAELITTGEVVGTIMLKHLPFTKGPEGLLSELIEYGLHLRSAFWGKGLAIELSRGVLGYGFDHLGLGQIVGAVLSQNTPCLALVKRIGMRYTGLSRAYYSGAKMNIFEMTRADWEERVVLAPGGSRAAVGYVPWRRKDGSSLSFFQGVSPATLGGTRFSFIRRSKRRIDHVSMNRGLLLSRPGDKVYCVAAGADPGVMTWNAQFVRKIYSRAGIETGEYVPLRGGLGAAMKKAFRSSAISPCVYDSFLYRQAGDSTLLFATETLNDKNRSLKCLASSGIGVPPSVAIPPGPWFLRKGRVLAAMETIGFPCYIKTAQGGGGYNVCRVDNPARGLAFARRWKYRFVSLQVQELVPGDSSDTVLYMVHQERVERLLVCRQRIVSDHLHAGTDWPGKVAPGILEETDRAAEACRNLGYFGMVGFDVKEKILEVNARTNTSALLQTAVERIPGVRKASFLHYHRQDEAELERLPLGDLWFGDGRGLLPVEWHGGSRGHVSVLVINDLDGSIEDGFRKACPPLIGE